MPIRENRGVITVHIRLFSPLSLICSDSLLTPVTWINSCVVRATLTFLLQPFFSLVLPSLVLPDPCLELAMNDEQHQDRAVRRGAWMVNGGDLFHLYKQPFYFYFACLPTRILMTCHTQTLCT